MTWKKLKSKLVYENDWMQVREDDVINPGGGTNHYGHVVFKNTAVAISLFKLLTLLQEYSQYINRRHKFLFQKHFFSTEPEIG